MTAREHSGGLPDWHAPFEGLPERFSQRQDRAEHEGPEPMASVSLDARGVRMRRGANSVNRPSKPSAMATIPRTSPTVLKMRRRLSNTKRPSGIRGANSSSLLSSRGGNEEKTEELLRLNMGD